MDVRFWGVRGSYPVTGAGTVCYGGNTSCIEVRLNDGTLIILDAGSGLRLLGDSLMAGDDGFATGDGNATIVLTHTHWDHIMGVPHFAPAGISGNQFTVYGRKKDVELVTLEDVFHGQQDVAYSDARFQDFTAEFEFEEILEGDMIGAGGATITTALLNHPCHALGYRVHADGATIVYITDTSPFTDVLLGTEFVSDPQEVIPPKGSPRRTEMAQLHDGVLKLMEGADLVIYDTFFEPEGYAMRYASPLGAQHTRSCHHELS
jgi:phosphoribosyl 1,2-cyclic phosphodiesterase